MAKIGRKSSVAERIPCANFSQKVLKREAAAREMNWKMCGERNSGMDHVIIPKMRVYGQFQRIKGWLSPHEILKAAEIVAFLDANKPGAVFIGKHAGRPVVAKRHRCCTTIEFTDVRSPYLPPLL